MDGIDWNEQLVGQLDWYWRQHFRPRLHSLTDDEYFWKPVQGCWNVHPRGASAAPVQAGGGVFTIDFAFPEPDPPPVTTIAWRMGHIIVGVLGIRASNHFGDRRSPTRISTTRARPPKRYVSSTSPTPHGVTAFVRSAVLACRVRVAPMRALLLITRWLRWYCTSTGKPSTMARRSGCCVTCTGAKRDVALLSRPFGGRYWSV
jgi:hypothetical protein